MRDELPHAVPPGIPTPVVVGRPIAAAEIAAARPAIFDNPLELRELSWRDAALDGTLVLTVTVLAHYLPDAIAMAFLPPSPPALLGQGWLIGVAKGVELLVAIVVACYLVRRGGVRAASFGWRLDGAVKQLMWAPVILAGVYTFMLFTAFALSPWLMDPGTAREELRERLEFINGLPTDQPLLLAAIFGIVGLHEELVFRGLLLTYGRRVLGSWWASILAGSLLFGLLHVPGQGLLAAAQITGVGVVLSLFFIWTRSLLAVAVAHAVFNFLQTQIARVLPALQQALEAATQPA